MSTVNAVCLLGTGVVPPRCEVARNAVCLPGCHLAHSYRHTAFTVLNFETLDMDSIMLVIGLVKMLNFLGKMAI